MQNTQRHGTAVPSIAPRALPRHEASSSAARSSNSSPPPEQVNAFLAPVWRGDESDNKRITTRSVTKRRSEANDPADGTGDKKAKAAAQSQAGPVAVKQEADGDLATRAAPHTSAHIPEPMEDPVDALLTLGLRTRVEPPRGARTPRAARNDPTAPGSDGHASPGGGSSRPGR